MTRSTASPPAQPIVAVAPGFGGRKRVDDPDSGSENPHSTAKAPGLRHNRQFNRLWLGEGVSVLGNATTSVLLPLLAVVRFGAGPGWMGALTAAAWLPWLIVGLPAGAWVDRRPPRAVMIASDLAAAALLLTVPAAAWAGRLSLVQLLLVAFGSGVCTVFFRTAYVKLIPEIAREADLEAVNARLFGTESAMQVAGPGVAGLLVTWLSAAFGLILDSASFLVSALCLWRINPRPAPQAPPARTQPSVDGASTTLRDRIAEGVRWVRQDRYVRWFTIIGGVSNLGLTGYMALLVLYLVRDLDLSPAGATTVLMVGSVGGLLGSLVANRLVRSWGSGRASTVLLLCGGPPALLIPLAGRGRGVVFVMLGLVLVGVCVVAGNIVRSAWRQRYVPRELMGRVVSAGQIVNYGTMPIAGVLAGWLGSQLGVRTTIALMAGVHVVACLSVLASPLARLRELPPPASGRRPLAG